MIFTVTDNVKHSIQMLKYLSKEVALEQMSKSGSAVMKSMRESLLSKTTSYETVVSRKKGNAYLKRISPPNELGIRIDHRTGKSAKGGENMANFIQWRLMEEHGGTLVVGGATKRHFPNKRRNGKVVGLMGAVPAVSQEAVSILHRLDTGIENATYNSGAAKSKLLNSVDGRGFMEEGKRKAEGVVRRYLEAGFVEVLHTAQSNEPTRTTTRRLG